MTAGKGILCFMPRHRKVELVRERGEETAPPLSIKTMLNLWLTLFPKKFSPTSLNQFQLCNFPPSTNHHRWAWGQFLRIAMLIWRRTARFESSGTVRDPQDSSCCSWKGYWSWTGLTTVNDSPMTPPPSPAIWKVPGLCHSQHDLEKNGMEDGAMQMWLVWFTAVLAEF